MNKDWLDEILAMFYIKDNKKTPDVLAVMDKLHAHGLYMNYDDAKQQILDYMYKYAQEYAKKIINHTAEIVLTNDSQLYTEEIKKNWDCLRAQQRKLNKEKAGKL